MEARTTASLIDELKAEAPKFDVLALAVGFEKETKFVFANDPDALKQLNEHVENGGYPMGYIGTVKTMKNRLEVRTRPLEEHAGDAFVPEYLHRLSENFAAQVEKMGGTTMPPSRPSDN